MPQKSLWDEWEETKARIEALFAEIKALQAREKELSIQIVKKLDMRGGGIYLTASESKVMDALYGPPMQTNKEIAAKLNISERTVKFHISSLLAKYGAKSRRELFMRFVNVPERSEG